MDKAKATLELDGAKVEVELSKFTEYSPSLEVSIGGKCIAFILVPREDSEYIPTVYLPIESFENEKREFGIPWDQELNFFWDEGK